ARENKVYESTPANPPLVAAKSARQPRRHFSVSNDRGRLQATHLRQRLDHIPQHPAQRATPRSFRFPLRQSPSSPASPARDTRPSPILHSRSAPCSRTAASIPNPATA